MVTRHLVRARIIGESPARVKPPMGYGFLVLRHTLCRADETLQNTQSTLVKDPNPPTLMKVCPKQLFCTRRPAGIEFLCMCEERTILRNSPVNASYYHWWLLWGKYAVLY